MKEADEMLKKWEFKKHCYAGCGIGIGISVSAGIGIGISFWPAPPYCCVGVSFVGVGCGLACGCSTGPGIK